MNPDFGIKTFLKPQKKQVYPQCVICDKPVRFPSRCDNCGGVVCHRHRPAFVSPWYCSKCIQTWSNWAQNNSSNDVVNQINLAENFYNEKRIVEAERIINLIVADLLNDDIKEKY